MDDKEYGDELFIYTMVLLEEAELQKTKPQSKDEDENIIEI